MKTRSKVTLALVMVIGLAMAGAAVAQNGGVGNDNGNGNDKHRPPAAPEPGLLLMAASGVALGGGYIVWRYKLLKNKSAA